MKISFLILGLVFLITPARAEGESVGARYANMDWGWRPPTWKEAAVLAPALGLLFVDVLQTVDIARHPGAFRETNPWLGPYPSVTRIWLIAGLGTAGAVTATWFALPPKVRWIVPVGLASIETAAVIHNFQIGLTLSL